MRHSFLFISFLLSTFIHSQVQTLNDNFQGTGNITTWAGDDCGMDNNFTNPFQTSANNSTKVLKYSDIGGQYANIRFDTGSNFDLIANSAFSLKIYVPSSGITGGQPNQISLKLQNGSLAEPWSTQCEIIKTVVLNQWQVITFNFATDSYINLNGGSPNPIYRSDFNRVVLQINGENNNNQVVAYLDDFIYNYTEGPIFNNLVWSDEFSGSGAINANNWFQQTQLPVGGNWYNGELQHYTNRQTNSFQSNGSLNIVAKRENFTDQGQTKQFTSARLNSKFAFKYGRVEARIKLPTGAGTWPAFWMLGKNIIEPGAFWSSTNGTALWPACGEIDIMEHWGNNQNYVQSAMHTPSSFGSTVNYGGQTISTASSQFHIYTLEWTSERMVFSVDNAVHYIYNPAVKNANTWPFDAPQYLLLNVAIDSNITGSFLQSTMEVDYVRVYQENALSIEGQTNLSDIIVYPNPVENIINIKVPNHLLGTKGKIYSILGQEVSSFSLNEIQSSIDVSNFKNGIYFLNVEMNNGFKTFKIIKN
jgi:beta-glucanase (GH16 family)